MLVVCWLGRSVSAARMCAPAACSWKGGSMRGAAVGVRPEFGVGRLCGGAAIGVIKRVKRVVLEPLARVLQVVECERGMLLCCERVSCQ